MKLDLGCGSKGTGDINVDTSRYKQNDFIVADAHHLPFRPEVFDVIKMHEVLEHLTSPYSVIMEARRCLKWKGNIEITVPNVWNWIGIARYLKRKNQLFRLLNFDGERFTDHKQGWDIYAFANLAYLTRLDIVNVNFFDRGIYEKTHIFRRLASRLLPSALAGHSLRLVLRRSNVEARANPAQHY